MAHLGKYLFASSIAMAVLLAGCGGGGGGGGGPGFVPPPPAPPAPPPPAGAPPHVFSFQYAVPVFGALFGLTVNSDTGASSAPSMVGLAEYGDISVQKNVNEYAIWAGQSAWDYDFPIFLDATLGANPTSGDEVGNFDYYRYTFTDASVSHSAQLQLLEKSPANTRIQLTYLTYGLYSAASGPPAARKYDTGVFLLGAGTAPSSMPATGTGTYSGIVDGHATVGGTGYRLLGSTGTLSANFATGAIATSLALQGNRDFLTGTLGSVQSFGTLTGAGTIGSGSSNYLGSLAGFGMAGEFTGGFFGPAANETGFSFYATGSAGADVINGVFLGKQ